MTSPLLERLFLHFYDIHFLKEKGATPRSNIFWECRAATRFAVIAADEVFVPAASFVESPLCRDVLLEFGELLHFGIIDLVAGSCNFDTFRDERLDIYAPGSHQHDSYSTISSEDVALPFKQRMRNTTGDIITHWRDRGNDNTTFTALTKGTDIQLPRDAEERWHQVPGKLGNSAFILDHVKPLLGEFTNNKLVEYRLLNLINAGYFQSYTEDLKAGVIVDLVHLDSGYAIPSFGPNLPYKHLLHYLAEQGALHDILNADGLKLLRFRSDERWLNAFQAAVQRRSRMEESRNLFYFKGANEMEKKFFIVHGHDHGMVFQLKDYLQNRLKLPEPVVLMQQPDAGRTIIEKFEDCAADVYGAMVLLTPDDLVKGGTAEEQKRARQNVIFELGYFVGKFGRKSGKVIMLHAGDLEMPSDLSGVIYINVKDGIEKAGEKIRLEIGA